MPAVPPSGVVRAARHDDVCAIGAVEVAAGQRFRDVGLPTIADAEPLPAEPLHRYVAAGAAWVVEAEGRLVGYAVVSVVDGEGHLDQVSVVPAATGRGLGTALLDTVCRWAATQGLHAVTLTTFAQVPWNGPYYARRGFVVVAEEDWGPELTAIRRREVDLGIDVAPRIAMRRALRS